MGPLCATIVPSVIPRIAARIRIGQLLRETKRRFSQVALTIWRAGIA
jgi:hypothetical protein